MTEPRLKILVQGRRLVAMSEEEGGAEDVSFLRTEDMVCLSCTGLAIFNILQQITNKNSYV
jgi:hypothetical protein